jgi:hypothetical protein
MPSKRTLSGGSPFSRYFLPTLFPIKTLVRQLAVLWVASLWVDVSELCCCCLYWNLVNRLLFSVGTTSGPVRPPEILRHNKAGDEECRAKYGSVSVMSNFKHYCFDQASLDWKTLPTWDMRHASDVMQLSLPLPFPPTSCNSPFPSPPLATY